MRTMLACLALAACATAPPSTPAERLAGCWQSAPPTVVIMRWTPDPAQPEAMLGVRNDPRSGALARYRLGDGGKGQEFCELGSNGAPSQCWAVAEGEGGSLEGGRAFIDRHGDRLTIEILGGAAGLAIFQGQRRECD